MFEETLVPLVLTRFLGEARGKTRFQKLVFVIQKKAIDQGFISTFFEYEPYLYGPFSMKLANIIDGLVAGNYLFQKPEVTTLGYTLFTYSLTSEGEELAERAIKRKLLNPKLVGIIKDVARSYGQLPLIELVRLAKGL